MERQKKKKKRKKLKIVKKVVEVQVTPGRLLIALSISGRWGRQAEVHSWYLIPA